MAMTMRTFKVRDLVGEFAGDVEAGEIVYNSIYPELVAGRSVELDFGGVRLVAPPFLNVAVGDLLRDIRAADFDRLFVATNLDALDDEILRVVINTSKRYFTDQTFRLALDTANAKVAAGDYDR